MFLFTILRLFNRKVSIPERSVVVAAVIYLQFRTLNTIIIVLSCFLVCVYTHDVYITHILLRLIPSMSYLNWNQNGHLLYAYIFTLCILQWKIRIFYAHTFTLLWLIFGSLFKFVYILFPTFTEEEQCIMHDNVLSFF